MCSFFFPPFFLSSPFGWWEGEGQKGRMNLEYFLIVNVVMEGRFFSIYGFIAWFLFSTMWSCVCAFLTCSRETVRRIWIFCTIKKIRFHWWSMKPEILFSLIFRHFAGTRQRLSDAMIISFPGFQIWIGFLKCFSSQTNLCTIMVRARRPYILHIFYKLSLFSLSRFLIIFYNDVFSISDSDKIDFRVRITDFFFLPNFLF